MYSTKAAYKTRKDAAGDKEGARFRPQKGTSQTHIKRAEHNTLEHNLKGGPDLFVSANGCMLNESNT
jgi:hypothetical protein